MYDCHSSRDGVEAHWLTSLSKLMYFKFSKGSHLKKNKGMTYSCHQIGSNWAGVQLEAALLLTIVHGFRRLCAWYWRRKLIITTTQLQKLWPTTEDSLSMYLCNSGTNVMGITNHLLMGFKALFVKWNPYHTLPKCPRTWDDVGHGSRGGLRTFIINIAIQWLLMTSCCNWRSEASQRSFLQ